MPQLVDSPKETYVEVPYFVFARIIHRLYNFILISEHQIAFPAIISTTVFFRSKTFLAAFFLSTLFYFLVFQNFIIFAFELMLLLLINYTSAYSLKILTVYWHLHHILMCKVNM